MIEIRPYKSLGHANHGWLKATHHFSFADYVNPERTGWGLLRVWNDDQIASQTGFPSHAHKDMEIITYVRKGAITHRDNRGNEGCTHAGNVQVMSAGTGIIHSEYNLETEDTLIFQIWVLPDQKDHQPSWETRPFPKEKRQDALVPLASGFPEDVNALKIHSKSRVLGATLKKGESLTHNLAKGAYAYLVPATGCITLNGATLESRDGAAIKDETNLVITATETSEFILVETFPL